MLLVPLNVARVAQRKLRRLHRLTSGAVFITPLAAAAGLAAAVHSGSPLLISLAAVALVGGCAGLAAWVAIYDRGARRRVRDLPWSAEQWREFEQSFWAHVSARSDSRPRQQRPHDEA
jgi:membrane associated rhomboid family serine protease